MEHRKSNPATCVKFSFTIVEEGLSKCCGFTTALQSGINVSVRFPQFSGSLLIFPICYRR